MFRFASTRLLLLFVDVEKRFLDRSVGGRLSIATPWQTTTVQEVWPVCIRDRATKIDCLPPLVWKSFGRDGFSGMPGRGRCFISHEKKSLEEEACIEKHETETPGRCRGETETL
ncbi:unnamed protein product [Ectocarpus fasciculatus]